MTAAALARAIAEAFEAAGAGYDTAPLDGPGAGFTIIDHAARAAWDVMIEDADYPAQAAPAADFAAYAFRRLHGPATARERTRT